MLSGKTAVVTGASRGIGRAIAEKLAAEGAFVVINYNGSKEAAETVLAGIRAAGGDGCVMQCNVSDFAACEAWMKEILALYGKIDILVNNAAGFGGGRTFDRMTYEEWDRLIRINLTGAYMFTNEVLPYMVKKQHGKICMVSSGAALGYDFSDPHYAASKAGMIGLAKELSQELAKHRINVNALGTGLTDTRMAHLPGRSWEDETKGLPWHRVGTPEDQAAAIVFLVSEAAEYITGQVLCPNGGAWM